jgi:hypothetical protein
MPNPYAQFEDEIARAIIGPKIMHVYEYHKCKTKQELYEAFNALFPVSRTVFDRWMEQSGLKIVREFRVEGVDDPLLEAVQSLGQSEKEPIHDSATTFP